MQPSLFIAHGAPVLAIQSNEYTAFLHDLSRQLPRPEAIVLFSAHWEHDVQQISSVSKYETIHDFYGFPEEMYQIRYPASGDISITNRIKELLGACGIPCETDQRRGLDHGAWVVLKLMYPDAQIPVIAMSVNANLSPMEQYHIGKALGVLRKESVLFIGSGGTVHNLHRLNWGSRTSDEWAVQFDEWLEARISDWDLPALFNYEAEAPNARLAVPPHGKEHFVPLFYAMGAADGGRKGKLLHRSYDYGSLSQSVWQFE